MSDLDDLGSGDIAGDLASGEYAAGRDTLPPPSRSPPSLPPPASPPPLPDLSWLWLLLGGTLGTAVLVLCILGACTSCAREHTPSTRDYNRRRTRGRGRDQRSAREHAPSRLVDEIETSEAEIAEDARRRIELMELESCNSVLDAHVRTRPRLPETTHDAEVGEGRRGGEPSMEAAPSGGGGGGGGGGDGGWTLGGGTVSCGESLGSGSSLRYSV